jgi:hypothetical protein
MLQACALQVQQAKDLKSVPDLIRADYFLGKWPHQDADQQIAESDQPLSSGSAETLAHSNQQEGIIPTSASSPHVVTAPPHSTSPNSATVQQLSSGDLDLSALTDQDIAECLAEAVDEVFDELSQPPASSPKMATTPQIATTPPRSSPPAGDSPQLQKSPADEELSTVSYNPKSYGFAPAAGPLLAGWLASVLAGWLSGLLARWLR